MQMTSKQIFDINEYYGKSHSSTIKKNYKDRYDFLCRVCLKKGVIPIYDNEQSLDILEALNTLANIEIKKDDKHPKHLCHMCYKFLQGAILFRKTAKESEEILCRPVKEEFLYEQQDHDYTDSFESKDPVQNWSTNEQNDTKDELKVNKREKIKQTAKVTCQVCNKVINRTYYKEHLTMHDPNHLKYVCDICGKSFRLRCAYHNHSLRHRDDFPYKCQFCPYKGRYAELLKTHMRTHTGDYRYMCTECPARFLFKSNLNSHMLKHKEPQFKCDSCKRAFHTNLMLRRHYEADHLGIKNHVCNMCGKAFGYRNAMMKHQRHVHKREKLLFGRMPSYLEAEQKT